MRLARFAVPACLPWVLLSGATPPKPLAIQNVTLSQFEDGPSVPGSYDFASGETIFLSFQVSGYKPIGEEEPAVRLTWRVDANDASGLAIVEPGTGRMEADLAREDKDWMPKIRHTILIPPLAPPGTYRITMAVKDEIAQTEVRKEAQFRVRGRLVEPSPTLVVRNLKFYRGEEDKDPLTAPAFRPGDAVWIKFDITGYKFGEKNRYEVGYGITVLRPNGEPTLSNPEAAVEKEESFYPRAYVPAMLSLNLPKDVQKGQYTVIITATDKAFGQKHEARATFTVEP